jgi:hypothetical protein
MDVFRDRYPTTVLHVTIFCSVKLCNTIDIYRRFGGMQSRCLLELLIDHDDSGSAFFQNIGKFISENTVMCPENCTLHSRCHGNSKSHREYRRQTSENINERGEQSPQNKAVSTSTKACSPTPPLVLKRERHTLNVLALSKYSITKKINNNKIRGNTRHCTALPGYY